MNSHARFSVDSSFVTAKSMNKIRRDKMLGTFIRYQSRLDLFISRINIVTTRKCDSKKKSKIKESYFSSIILVNGY